MMESAPKRLKVHTIPKTFYQKELDRCDDIFTQILHQTFPNQPDFVSHIEDPNHAWYIDDRQTLKYEYEDLEIDKQEHFSNIYVGQITPKVQLDPRDKDYSNLLEYKLHPYESKMYFNEGCLPNNVVMRIAFYAMDNDSTSAYAFLSICKSHGNFKITNAKMFAPMLAPKMLFGSQERAACWLYKFLSTPFDLTKSYANGPHNAMDLRRFDILGLGSQELLNETFKTARKTCVLEAMTGTGKTVTVLNAIERYKPYKKKVLIVCPSILTDNVYMVEFRKFFEYPGRMINMFDSIPSNYMDIEYIVVNFNFIDNQAICGALMNIGHFDVVVVDEFHLRYQHAIPEFITKRLNVDNIILMSATPPRSAFIATNTYHHVKTTPEKRMAEFFGFTHCHEIGLNLIDNNKDVVWYVMKTEYIPKPLNHRRYIWKMLNPIKINWEVCLQSGKYKINSESNRIHFNPEYGFGKALNEVINERKRLIIFSEDQEILDRTLGFLRYYNTKADIFDLRKSTKASYTKFSKKFNVCKNDEIIIVASVNVAGVGINFHTKDISTIVFLEMDYDDMDPIIKQCEGRIARVGQATSCKYYYFNHDHERSTKLLHNAFERYFESLCLHGFLGGDLFTIQLYRYCIIKNTPHFNINGVHSLDHTLRFMISKLKTDAKFNCFLPVYILMFGSVYFAESELNVYIDHSDYVMTNDKITGCTLERFLLGEITKATIIDPSITDMIIELADRYLPFSRSYLLKNHLRPAKLEPAFIDYDPLNSMF